MDALEMLFTRRSVKSYWPDRMPDAELIEKVIEAGTFAPSGRGKQSALIVAITQQAVRDELSAINAQILGTTSDPFYGAPVALLVLADSTSPTHRDDGALVMGNLLNAAHAVGLGACWIHRARETFETERGQQLLRDWGISDHYVGIGYCVMGYGNKTPRPATPRKADYVHYIR